MRATSIRFSGQVLGRGFWLYVVDIEAPRSRFLYVGRAGDSSSPNAGSPFRRIGQHLDLRPTAKGNALLRNLRQAGVDPVDCEMEMIAVGPLFPEQTTFESHKPVRDKMAALERDLAQCLRNRGYQVLGNHAARGVSDPQLLHETVACIEAGLVRDESRNTALQPAAAQRERKPKKEGE